MRHAYLTDKQCDLADNQPDLEVYTLLPLDRPFNLADKPSNREVNAVNHTVQPLVGPDKSLVGPDHPFIRPVKSPDLEVSAFIRTGKAS